MFIEGKYLGKSGLEYCSPIDFFDKLKNIMKFYKQVFIIQSETDLMTASSIYQVAIKSKKVFVESTFLCNLATLANGSCPTPFTAKKVYSYNPLELENRDFEFKRKYVTPFYINSIVSKMKKEKYVMNINKDMFQDISVFNRNGSFYDACVIISQWNGFVENDSELKKFIELLKNYDIDYFELYNRGQVDIKLLKNIISKINPRYVIPLDFSEEKDIENKLSNFKVLKPNQQIQY